MKYFKRILFFLFLWVTTIGCSKKLYTDSIFFNCKIKENYNQNTDLSKLIYKVLKRSVVEDKDISDYQLIKDKKKIYILDRYYSDFFGSSELETYPLDKSNVPSSIAEVRFCIKSKEELQNIADSTSDFLYLTFRKIVIKDNIATIGIDNGWKAKTNGKTVYMSGGGYILQFKKGDNQWKFYQVLNNWVS